MVLALAKCVVPSFHSLRKGLRRTARLSAIPALFAGNVALVSLWAGILTAFAAMPAWGQDHAAHMGAMRMESVARPAVDAPAAPFEDCNGNGDPTKNPNHILPAGGDPSSATSPIPNLLIGSDKNGKPIECHVDGKLKVNGAKDNGVYVYANVNVINGGTLVFDDADIDFHAHSILIERGGTLRAGPISKRLTIYLWGGPFSGNKSQKWTGGSDTIPSITCQGDGSSGATICGVPADVWKSNPSMAMHDQGSAGSCKTVSKMAVKDPWDTKGGNFALPNGTDDCFYQYEVVDKGEPLSGAFFGRKVLAVSEGGNLMLKGTKGIRDTSFTYCGQPTQSIGPIELCPADSGTSWGRLTQDAKVGDITIYVDRALPTWSASDQIILTTTDFLPSHTEQLEIVKVTNTAAGATITLKSAVKYPHSGTAYDYSAAQNANKTAGPTQDPEQQKLKNVLTPLPAGHVETRAIVGLLTRSIVIASEGLSPVLTRGGDHFATGKQSMSYYGGHVMARQGIATFEVQGVEFQQLGQGGLIGRYPVHFHMDRKVPQYNPAINGNNFFGTFLADSSIVDSMTRFVTIHATQGVTLARNVGFGSIGQGYYLEDATEINNRLYSNLGVNARSALLNAPTNPRNVPGILSRYYQNDPTQNNPDGNPWPSDYPVPDDFPSHSDVNNPSPFWIQNSWNDIEYNAAVGAGACGACYWMTPATIAGPSRYEYWTGYASVQKSRGGSAPINVFQGNTCSTAMFALQTISNTQPCSGIYFSDAGGSQKSTDARLYAVPNQNAPLQDEFPYEAGQKEHATVCDDQNADCSVKKCAGTNGEEADCAVSAVDRFTTSFNWAPVNFSAIWMRGWWQLVQNSAITDQAVGGLTFISGGGFTRSDASQGFWSVLKNSVLVGNTQPLLPTGSDGVDYTANPYASPAGPFNPKGISTCASDPSHRAAYCASADAGIIFSNSNTGNFPKLFNIYDGPAAQYNNIYSDVHPIRIGEYSKCDPGGQNCANLGFAVANNAGNALRSPKGSAHDLCYLPSAAIGWKQPNGFYYPPAFHSHNLVFDKVDIRHFVIQPLYKDYDPNNYFTQNVDPNDPRSVPSNYCGWNPTMFSGSFTDIDRETELGDDDGSLTGLKSKDPSEDAPLPSVSVTKALFNNAPITTDECASGQFGVDGTLVDPTTNQPDPTKPNQSTVNTSPYEYLTLAAYQGTDKNVNQGHKAPTDPDASKTPWDPNFSQDCGSIFCYGIPLYRQYLTDAEMADYNKYPKDVPGQTKAHYPTIRMMGGGNGTRSAMVMNHVSYYIDTSLPLAAQKTTGTTSFNVFFKTPTQPQISGKVENYTFFLLFANQRTQQRYSMFVGKNSNWTAADVKKYITPVRIGLDDSTFPVLSHPDSASWLTITNYDPDSGIATLQIDLKNESDLDPSSRADYCQPKSYCEWKGSSCGCKAGTNCKDDQVCSYATKDLDCPTAGCYGFQLKLPDSFPDLLTASAASVPPPPPINFADPKNPDADYFKKGNITFANVDPSLAGNPSCQYGSHTPLQEDGTIMQKPEAWHMTPNRPLPLQFPNQ